MATPFYDPEEERFKSQLAMAQALRKQAMMMPADTEGKMLNLGMGMQQYIPGESGSQLPFLRESLGALQEQGALRGLSGLQQNRQAEEQAWLGQMPGTRQTVVDGEAGEATLPKTADQLMQEYQTWAQQAPVRSQTGSALRQALLNKSLQRPFEMEEREEKRATALELAREKAADQARRDRERAEDKKENIRLMAALRPAKEPQRDRFQIVTDSDGTQYRVNLDTGDKVSLDLTKPLSGKGGAAADKAKKASSDLLDKLKLAEEGLPYSSGMGTLVPQGISQLYTSPETKMANANIAAVSAEKAHELYGAAFTAAERSRARQFMPDIGDTVENQAVKIKAMRILLEKKMAREAGQPDPYPDAYKNILDSDIPSKPDIGGKPPAAPVVDQNAEARAWVNNPANRNHKNYAAVKARLGM